MLIEVVLRSGGMTEIRTTQFTCFLSLHRRNIHTIVIHQNQCVILTDKDVVRLQITMGERLRKVLRRIGILRSPEWLARRALRALRRGRRCISPGVTNYLVPLLVALLPSRLIDRLGLKWIR